MFPRLSLLTCEVSRGTATVFWWAGLLCIDLLRSSKRPFIQLSQLQNAVVYMCTMRIIRKSLLPPLHELLEEHPLPPDDSVPETYLLKYFPTFVEYHPAGQRSFVLLRFNRTLRVQVTSRWVSAIYTYHYWKGRSLVIPDATLQFIRKSSSSLPTIGWAGGSTRDYFTLDMASSVVPWWSQPVFVGSSSAFRPPHLTGKLYLIFWIWISVKFILRRQCMGSFPRW